MRALLVAMLGAVAWPAAAQELPSFFEGTKLYSRDLAFCPGNPNPPDTEGTLQISKAGLYGYELGCTFLGFVAEKDPESGVVYSWQAQAQCGDDSGITRPDVFAVIFNEGQDSVTVQSQNEYMLGMMLSMAPLPGNKDPFEEASWLSGTYALCPTY